jgi:hypothetical protein
MNRNMRNGPIDALSAEQVGIHVIAGAAALPNISASRSPRCCLSPVQQTLAAMFGLRFRDDMLEVGVRDERKYLDEHLGLLRSVVFLRPEWGSDVRV